MQLRFSFFLAGLLCLQSLAWGQKAATSEAELRKQADRFFQEQAYVTAVGPYSQLLSLQPNDATLNYRYGVSLLLSGKDKRNAVGYLEKAMGDPTQPLEGWVYLGRSYMFLGKFEDARSCFSRFNQRATDAQRKKFASEEWIRSASAAIELSRQRRLVSTTSQKEVARSAFFSQIDYSQTAGRVLPTADRFLTTADKDKQITPVMYMARDGQTIYYASYGKGSLGGKDLYLIRKMTNNEWAEPEHLGGVLNTAMNEDFPFLDRDGKTLYFASQGHNSIGGYDLFKSVFNFNTGQWSAPENLGIPLNSPDDDLLYVPGSDGVTAVYSTADFTDNAHTELRTIRLDDLRNPFATIRGTYFSIDQPMRRDARVIVLKASDRSVVTTVRTDPRTGSYELVLPGGESYWLVIDGGGYVPHTESFDLPAGLEKAALRQEVRMDRNKQEERMTVTNYFTPMPSTVDATVIAVNDRPTTSQTTTTAETGESVQVTVGNEVLTVRKPSAPPAQATSDSGAPLADADANPEDTTQADNYNPMLERELTQDELRQRQEEQLRAEEVVAEEKIPAENLRVPVDERELAQNAVADGIALQEEADSLQRRSQELRASATNREEEAIRLLEEAQSIRQDSVRAASLYLQSDDMKQLALAEKQQAGELDALARERRTEAHQALTDAKALITSTNTKDKTLASSVDQALARNAQGPRNEPATTTTSPTVETGTAVAYQEPSVEVRTEGVVSQEKPAPPSASTPEETAAPSVANTQPAEPATSRTAQAQTPLTEDGQEPVVTNAATVGTPETTTPTSETSTSSADVPTGQTPSQLPGTDEPTLATTSAANASNNPEQVGTPSGAQPASSERTNAADNISQTTQPIVASSGQPSAGNGTPNPTAATSEQQTSPSAQPGVTESIPATSQQGTNERAASAMTSSNPSGNVAANPASSSSMPQAAGAPASTTASGTSRVTNATPSQAQTQTQPQSQPGGAAAPSQGQTNAVSAQQPATNATRTTPATRLTEVPAMEGVSEETRLAYQNYKQRMEFSDRLDTRSKELQNQVATMKNSPERDSLIQLANSMSMESIRQWQSAQAQLRQAKADDPEIQAKAEAAIAAAPKQEPAMDVQPEAQPVAQTAIPAGTPAGSTTTAFNQSGQAALQSDSPQLAQSSAPSGEMPSQTNADNRDAAAQAPGNVPVSGGTEASGTQPAAGNTAAPTVSTNVGQGPVSSDPATQPIEAPAQAGSSGTQPVLAQDNSRQGGNNPSVAAPAENAPRSTNVSPGTSGNTTSNDVASPQSNQTGTTAGNATQGQSQQANTPGSKPGIPADVTQSGGTPASAAGVEPAGNANTPVKSDPGSTEQPTTGVPLRSGNEGTAMQSGTTQPAPGELELVYDTAAVRSKLQSPEEVPTARLDSSHKDFPRYLKLRQEVGEKQDETIRLFASAIELNKQASQEKEQQVNLMQKAEATADANEKAKLLRQAEKRKQDSEAHEAEAGKLMAQAQKLSDEIWDNNQQLEALSLAIRKSGPARTSPTASSTVPAAVSPASRPAPVTETDETVRAEAPGTSPQAGGERAPVKAGPLTVSGIERMVVRSDKPAYTNASPIPVDQPLPEGLVFKVQIGAFRKPIPNEAFGGLSPVSAENTRPGWIRYCVGLFRTFEPANIVKKSMRGQGFKDAFVVAYYNGKRITLGEAYAMLNQAGGDSRTAYASASREEMQRLRELNIVPVRSAVPDPDEQEFFGGTTSTNTGSTGGVAYAVQVGVYRSSVPPAILGSLQPLQQEALSKGLFRYTTGRYAAYASADSMRRVAVNTGIADAFVVAYRDGRRVSVASAQRSTATVAGARVPASASIPDSQPQTSVSPASSDAITFRVQVGAFRQQVPFRVVDALLKVSDRGVEREQDPRGLQVFFAGRFSDYESARKLKEEVVGRGVPDAFVVAFSGRQRIPLAEALRRVGE